MVTSTESVPAAEQLRKVEELKRITADKAIGRKGDESNDKKEPQFIRVFYS
jgi:hypothetical protein